MKFSQKPTKRGVVKEVRDGFEDLGNELIKSSQTALKDTANDFSSQLFGDYSTSGRQSAPVNNDWFKNPDNFNNLTENSFNELTGFEPPTAKEPVKTRKIEVVFNRMEYQQRQSLENEIHQLMQVVKQEVEMLKVEDNALLNDISKLSLGETSKSTGIYHLRFLEFVIRLLKAVRKKISESRMWLEATLSRKKAKGFRGLAKKHGTSFSMSKELSQANAPG